MATMSPTQAREYWKALVDNAAALIADANVLFNAESYGRARSLTVLAQEELGKALWVYDSFHRAWSEGDEVPRTVDMLARHGRTHTEKYLEACVFGDELAAFWGDFDAEHTQWQDSESWEEAHAHRRLKADAASRQANLEKKRGFYVDRDADGTIHSPADIEAGTIADDLQTAAQVVEMLLIKDHSRMKFDATTPYDSTHPQQFRLLPISHPDDWSEASEDFKRDPGVPPA
ncbi:AbiV family abortive infection protein (plasmid) [Rhodococcus pyridinivorans]|uniref:AbiV family abortive infection protein n=1 Tax=Rhodococcus pyridinivorans TaxID=103816 RepID=UPI0020004744|nr:AbiV family abortive infection protein [Rhodococcus pyridinivorans]UPK66465.1 AbiV family abortive infection protein [Rhodococcus pyridinivorans]